MSREDAVWIVFAVVLLVFGFVIGQRYIPLPQGEEGAPPPADAGSFRAWFWQERSLDLAAQVGLIVVGALSIAGLLPRRREEGAE
jgi:hypothetical protein